MANWWRRFRVLRIIVRFSLWLLILLGVASTLLVLTGNSYVFKGLQATYLKGKITAGIYDNEDFPFREIPTSHPIFRLPTKTQIKLNSDFKNYLEGNKTAAFLVLHNDSLICERYFDGHTVGTRSNSFSIAKTLTVLLTLKAVEEGYIKSVQEPITNYLPEMKQFNWAKDCTIWDLMAMTSGYDWKEDYFFPINPTAKAYYDDDLSEVILTRGFTKKPHTEFRYLSGNTQLLGFILQRALKETTISDYLSKKIWKPLGMEASAYWSLDNENGIEKTYCCVHAIARDFAKIGLLLLKRGNWNGKQIFSQKAIEEMITPNGFTPYYGLGLWMDYENNEPFFYLRGHLGQYVICLPQRNLVIIRLGEWKSPVKRDGTPHSEDVYRYVNEGVKMVGIYK